MSDAPFKLPASWPLPADLAAADRLRERFEELGAAERSVAADPSVRAMLAGIGGNSPFLSDLAIRETEALRTLIAHGPDSVASRALAELAEISPTEQRARLAAALRRAKRIIALTTAIADIGGLWPLERVTQTLSALADAALQLSVAHLLRAAHDAGELRLPDPARPAQGGGLTVLGMGKLGGRELNYSSDVDLVLLYDPDAGVYTDRHEGAGVGAFYTRIARQLVSLMEARDANGYVFRTDLRLRPDPSATPPAVALPAAIAYYESMGENWERAAMSKARPLAGDLALGESFLREIRPFVWRRGLDFAALADIHAMKRRIDTHKRGALGRRGSPAARVAGHNVKLGEGGIREIEFLAQTLQLVWGGRDPHFRDPTTLGALRLLAQASIIPQDAADQLAASYYFLRSVEHRLQMVADRQIHTLPERANDLQRFACFMGFSDADAFANCLISHLTRVRAWYATIFESVPDLPDSLAEVREQLDFTGNQEVPEGTVAALKSLGYTNVQSIISSVRGWNSGHIRALRSERARELIEHLLPNILAAIATQPHPDTVFTRFDALLSRLPAGVQILSLFQRNPQLLDRVATVLGAAPSLAEHLARHPAALDGLLALHEGGDPAGLLRTRLQDVRPLEDALATIRRTVREEDFNLSVATLECRLDADETGLRRTKLAGAALVALMPRVLDDFEKRSGHVPGGEMVAVALGKAGSGEMMAGSDLDLMLVYDHPEDVTESRGARTVPASQWFIRAAQAFIAVLTAPSPDGPLYAVDMRLRPSGNKGPFAVSLSAFRRYHAESAWTWERMALTRARVVAGPPALAARVQAAITEAVAAASKDPDRVRADAAAMRARMLRDLPPEGPWDVKLRPGGLIEVEFIAQVLQLVHARERPDLCNPATRRALAGFAEAGLLPQADAELLIRADRLWRTVQGMLRVALGRGAKEEALPEASARSLLRAAANAGAPAVDVTALRATLDTLAGEVRGAFVQNVGDIAS